MFYYLLNNIVTIYVCWYSLLLSVLFVLIVAAITHYPSTQISKNSFYQPAPQAEKQSIQKNLENAASYHILPEILAPRVRHVPEYSGLLPASLYHTF